MRKHVPRCEPLGSTLTLHSQTLGRAWEAVATLTDTMRGVEAALKNQEGWDVLSRAHVLSVLSDDESCGFAVDKIGV